MNIIKMEELSVASTKSVLENPSFIGDDLLLIDDLAGLPLPEEPRRLKCLIVALCLKGKAQYSVDTVEHLVRPGDIIIINEGMVTDNFMFSRDFNGIALLMNYDFFRETIKGIHELSQLFLFSRTHPVFNLNDNESRDICFFFEVMKAKVNEVDNHFREEIVRSLLTTMIYEISNVIFRMQQLNDKRRTRAETIFGQFIKLVEDNFRRERRVSWYGEQLCITPKYLSETVKQVSRRTPNEWIDNYVILETRVLLRNSTMSIKEIARALNFPNQSFLGKYFKEHVGMSPSEYRKK